MSPVADALLAGICAGFGWGLFAGAYLGAVWLSTRRDEPQAALR